MPDQPLPLVDGPITFEGAVSLEVAPEGVHAWRLPHGRVHLFHPWFIERASFSSGVRLTLLSDTPSLTVDVEPLPGSPPEEWTFDFLVDGKLAHRHAGPPQRQALRLAVAQGPRRERRLELWLPQQYIAVRIRSATIEAGASASRWTDTRKRWVAYGSSITHAGGAAGPSESWSALVAARFDLHLTNLGYGSNEHMEPLVARMIRDLPADAISICVGGNIWSLASLVERTYPAALIGMIEVIREKHPQTPIAVTSFINYPPKEGQPNSAGLDLATYRRMTRETVEMLQAHGDAHLSFTEGLNLWGPDFAHLQPDGAHPNAEGQHILAKRYIEMVMPKLGF